MTAKHTPGPWRFDPESGEVLYADNDIYPLIATVCADNVDPPQFLADGHLVAEAPAMLNIMRRLDTAQRDNLPYLREAARAILHRLDNSRP